MLNSQVELGEFLRIDYHKGTYFLFFHLIENFSLKHDKLENQIIIFTVFVTVLSYPIGLGLSLIILENRDFYFFNWFENQKIRKNQ